MTKGTATVTFPNGETATRRTNNPYAYAVVTASPAVARYGVLSMHTTKALAERACKPGYLILPVVFTPAEGLAPRATRTTAPITLRPE